MFSFERMFPPPETTFRETYKCFSVSMLPGNERLDVERGGKIIMPPSALDKLKFEVLSKIPENGSLINTLMMRNLLLEEGGLLSLENISLPVATFTKFQPQSPDFLDITNPKAVLEQALRNFACLSAGDMVAITYNNRVYELCVLETKPGKAVSIIECDMNVDFAAPVGYQEPERQQPSEQQEEEPVDMTDYVDPSIFRAFQGSGNRLDGKKKDTDSLSSVSLDPSEIKRGVPNYDYKRGKITFIRASRPKISNGSSEDDSSFEAFTGEGQSLRKKQGRK